MNVEEEVKGALEVNPLEITDEKFKREIIS